MTQPLARPLTTDNRMLRASGADQIRLPGSVGVSQAFNTPTMGGLVVSGAAQIAANAPDQSPDQIMAEQEADAMARQEAAQLSARLDFADAAEREVLLDQIDGLMTRRKVRVDTRTKQAVADGKMQAPEALAEQYAALGLKFDRAMTPAEAKLIADGRKAQIVREALIAQTPGGIKQGAAMFGAGLLAMATDPLEVATMFIPVVGQAGKAAAIARFGRVGGRVAVGVTEGAVGSALTEPVYMGLSRAQQLDYTMSDALMNVGLGAVLGGGIGTVAGLLARRAPDARVTADSATAPERVAAPSEAVAAPMAADAPVRAEAAPDAPVRAADAIAEPAALVDEPVVRVSPETRALAAEQRQAADTALRQFVNGQGVDVAEVMPQGRDPASWVIIDKETGKAVMETFQKSVAEKVNTERFQAVPILDYLVSINGKPKTDVQEFAATPPDPRQAATAAAGRASDTNLEVLDNNALARIGVDARTFQFKAGGDEEGVTERLKGVKTWEPERAGVGLIYEYADGRRVIVDGHQRFGLAKKLASEGQKIELPVRVLREVDGVTPEQARARAAIKNIAEGTGTPLDAAKVLRDLGVTADAINLPPSSVLARQGEGLSRLSDDAFGMVINEKATEAHGALVGSIVKDPAVHADILALVTKLKPKNAFEAESIIRQADEAGSFTEVQTSLFGDEMVAQSLFLERARVLDNAVKQLREDRATFNVLLERSERIVDAGNSLDAEANAKRLQESGSLMQYVQRQANMKGPISDALGAAARKFKSGAKVGTAVKEFVGAVREAISRGDFDGESGRAGGRADEPFDAPQPVAEQALDDAPSLFGDMMPAPIRADVAPSQAVIPGADRVQTADAQRAKSEMEARVQQSRMGRLDQTRVEDDAGGLFGETTGDMFAAPKPRAAVAASLAKAADVEPLANIEAAAAFETALPDAIQNDIADLERMVLQLGDGMTDAARADLDEVRLMTEYASTFAEVADAAATCVARLG